MKKKQNKKKKFSLVIKSREDDFNTEYRKFQQTNNSISILKKFEDDKEFMLAFQNEFIEAPTFPDVSKYWEGLFSKEKIDATFLNLKGIDTTKKNFPSENELLQESNEFNKLIAKKKAPKECYTHKITETNTYKQFKVIEDILNRFKEMSGFDNSANSLLQQAEEFGKGLISEIQNIHYEPIKIKIIETIIKDNENNNSFTKWYINNNFNKKEFDDNYAKAKMYLDNYLKNYLETQNQKVKTEKLNEAKEIDICLKDFLFNPSDKHKLPIIAEKFKNEKGKSMAIAIYLLRDLKILNYEINSKTKSRTKLTKLLNPDIKMSGVNMFFNSNTYELQNPHDDDLNPIKQWLNGL